MLRDVGKQISKTVLGCDFGTKFEGYPVISGKENILNMMWKLHDKRMPVKSKKLINKYYL